MNNFKPLNDTVESAKATMANVDFARYRRIVQLLWDPEPTNDPKADVPVWCLGERYRLNGTYSKPTTTTSAAAMQQPQSQPSPTATTPTDSEDALPEPPLPEPPTLPATTTPDTPPDSVSSSFDSALAYEEPGEDGSWPPAFLDDFESKFWMTYRSEFEPIPKSTDPRATAALSFSMRLKSQLGDQSGFASDSGWGCMIRSGQSMLANALAMVHLGRDWRRGKASVEERQLLSKFADDPRAPYSIHNFVKHGAVACGKYPGEWFGPSATARCIQSLANETESTLRVYSTGDGPDVYEDAFLKIAKPEGEEFHPTLILVGTRLGIDKITQVYWEALIASVQMKQSVGIAGGRPSSSHYFIGAQGPYLFYLDPHHTRPALPYYEDPDQYLAADVDTCHTRRLRRLHVREMDPSMLIGFLIRDEEDWLNWRRDVRHVQGKAIISVADHNPLTLGTGAQRDAAIDEVETLSDEDDDDDETILEL